MPNSPPLSQGRTSLSAFSQLMHKHGSKVKTAFNQSQSMETGKAWRSLLLESVVVSGLANSFSLFYVLWCVCMCVHAYLLNKTFSIRQMKRSQFSCPPYIRAPVHCIGRLLMASGITGRSQGAGKKGCVALPSLTQHVPHSGYTSPSCQLWYQGSNGTRRPRLFHQWLPGTACSRALCHPGFVPSYLNMFFFQLKPSLWKAFCLCLGDTVRKSFVSLPSGAGVLGASCRRKASDDLAGESVLERQMASQTWRSLPVVGKGLREKACCCVE